MRCSVRIRGRSSRSFFFPPPDPPHAVSRRPSGVPHLPPDPRHQHLHDIRLFGLRQRTARRDAVPLGETSPAAAPRGVLCHEDRMPPHRGLAPVVGREGRGEPLSDKIPGMLPDRCKALRRDIVQLRRPQSEAAPERRPGETFEKSAQCFGRKRSAGNRKVRRFRDTRPGGSGRKLPRKARIRCRPYRRPPRLRRRSGGAVGKEFGIGCNPPFHGRNVVRQLLRQSMNRTFDSSRGLASGDSSG